MIKHPHKPGAFTRLLCAVMALFLAVTPVTTSFAQDQSVALSGRSLGARANTPAGISAAGGALVTDVPVYARQSIYVPSAQALKRWKAARNGVLLGTRRARIITVGDSTTAGVGAVDILGRRQTAYPGALSRKLTDLGVPSTYQSFMGSQNTATASTTTFDPRLVLGAGWATDNAIEIPGGRTYLNSTTTNGIAWTPDVQVDTNEIYSLGNTGLGTFSWDIDGGSATNISTNITQAFKKDVTTTTLGSHTLNIKRVSGSNYIAGVISYNSAVPAVDVVNGGRGSATTTILVGTGAPWNPLTGFPNLQGDLYIIDIGINDWNPANSISVATYKAQLTTFAAACYAVGDVILRVPAPSDTSWQSIANQELYRTAIYEVARAGGYVVVDMFDRWQNKAAANSLGYYFDIVHPSTLGYMDEGQFMGQFLATN